MTYNEFQKLDDQSKKEWLTRVSNLVSSNERSFRVMNYWLQQEEKYCNDNHIRLPKIYYNNGVVKPADKGKQLIEMFPEKSIN